MFNFKPYDKEDYRQRILKYTAAKKYKMRNAHRYYNLAASFDIEASSVRHGEDKYGVMYVWQFGIEDELCYGRTWAEFLDLIYLLHDTLKLDPDKLRLLVYVHNLSYEFQWIRKYFEWVNIFALADREPVKACTSAGVEFRCSLKLSGYSLENLGKNLTLYPVEKKTGDLDYKKIRHPGTPLTDKELGYCAADIEVVINYIRERIKIDGCITKILLTKTSYVRKFCRNKCLYSGNHKQDHNAKRRNYMALMKRLRLSPVTYQMAKAAFMGGFVHANAWWTGSTVEQVRSKDFTSAYPAVMLSEKFPMDSGEQIDIRTVDELERNIASYCCIFTVRFSNIRSHVNYEHYIPVSKCPLIRRPRLDNGRVVSADELVITITDQDFIIIRSLYEWDALTVSNFWRFKRGYLPRDFHLAILELYGGKTKLKGIESEILEYSRKKGDLNALFGMCVTDVCRDEIIYTDDAWGVQPCNIEEQINKHNDSVSRFLYYLWGVFITSYNRANLFTAICELGDDYIYSDLPTPPLPLTMPMTFLMLESAFAGSRKL